MASPQNKDRLKKAVGITVRILISAVLLAVLYYNIDFASVIHEVITMPLWFLACMILLTAVGIILEVVKWRALRPSIPFTPFLKAFLYCEFFMLVLPGQLFGEAAKVVAFGKFTGRYDLGISTVVIDKMTGFLALLSTGLTGLLLTQTELHRALVLVFSACIIALFVLFFSLRTERVQRRLLSLIEWPGKKFPRFQKVCGRASGLVEIWREYLIKPKILVQNFGYGALFNAFMIFHYMLICRIYEIPVGVFDLCWIMSTIGVVQVMPVSFAGIGIRDISLVAMFAFIGISAENAVILALFLFLVIIFRAIAGAVCVLMDIIGTKK